MPRWNPSHVSEARTQKIILSCRPLDKDTWKAEAKAQGMSMSRWVYIRCRAAGPLPGLISKDPQLTRELASLGNNLNQLVRIFHHHGLSADTAAEALSLVHELHGRLTR
jgi:hypothetical protein